MDVTNRDPSFHLLCFATQGSGSNDEGRVRALLERLEPALLPFDRRQKAASFGRVVWRGLRERPDLIVMEGTGMAGGLAVLVLRFLRDIPYVVSSGDAVAPFVRSLARALGPAAWLYERLLCSKSAGYIGWTPYLAGRAITLGAPRAMTAANWAPTDPIDRMPSDRRAVRASLGIEETTIVFGIVGSLAWNKRRAYCYGLELVRAATLADRADVCVLVVGDGDGLSKLEGAKSASRTRTVLTGRVAREDVQRYLAAMDVGSLPQSVDGVGSFRYTTKLSEYLSAQLPVVTGRLPFAYDLDDGWLWRLPGDAPWHSEYVDALARLMRTITREMILERRGRVPTALAVFDKCRQQRGVESFITEIIADAHSRARIS